MPENKDILKELDNLFNDFTDLERSVYLDGKNLLTQGITYSIEYLSLSNKKETFIPLNLIKPFFKIFHSDKFHGLYQAKYKKRPVLLSFRDELDMIPLCLTDTVEFKVSQNNKFLWSFAGPVSDLLKPNQIVIKDLTSPLTFHLKLTNTSERFPLEQEMDSSIWLNQKLAHEKMQSKMFNLKLPLVENTLSSINNIPNLNFTNINLNHLTSYSRDVLVLTRLIENLKFDKINDLDTQEMKRYRHRLTELQNNLTPHLNFNSTKVVLNFKA